MFLLPIEHSGLGRYGDSLNPWGDLIAMAQSWCLLKPGAKALVGVPGGKDSIGFNELRIYGRIMFPHLFANWKQIYTTHCSMETMDKITILMKPFE